MLRREREQRNRELGGAGKLGFKEVMKEVRECIMQILEDSMFLEEGQHM